MFYDILDEIGITTQIQSGEDPTWRPLIKTTVTLKRRPPLGELKRAAAHQSDD